MKITQPLPILLRLTQVIEGFLGAIWNYRIPHHGTAWGTIPAIEYSIIARVMGRMRRAERALQSLMARFVAGKLRPSKPRGPLAKPRTQTPPKQKPLPSHFAWLCPLMPAEAAIRGNHLMLVLAEPEMQELLAASPRARAILKPICRMLAIDPRVLAQVGRISEAQSTVATLTHAEPAAPAATPPIHGAPINRHLLVLWRPQSDP
jgi:hypothetical protein